jgi:predicted membrane-bound spermidine synthase
MVSAALVIFFASGFAALVYQVIWQRTLVIFSGADIHSATIVVAAFMAGLGCGSLAGGVVADRVSRKRSLALFAAAELGIALFGFASNRIFYDVLYLRFGELGFGLVVTAALLFLGLLWPTFFMGVSLPLLARGLTRDVNAAASTIGWLYAANTFGAAAGAAIATWWFLPQFGLEGGVRIAAAVNLSCAAAAIPLVLVGGTLREDPAPRSGSAILVDRSRRTLPFAGWAALFGLAGFIALSLELVWFRLLGVMLKSTAFTFGTMLALYLLGLAVGAAIGSAAARLVPRPALGFCVLQAGAGAYAAWSLSSFVSGLGSDPAYDWYWKYFGNYDGFDASQTIIALNGDSDFSRLYLWLPLALIGPSTLMSGASFPLLQRVVQTDLRLVGRRVGVLLASNIVGSTLGAFVTGWLVLGWLGTAGTVTMLLALSGVFALVAVWYALGSWTLRAALGVVAVVLVVTLAGQIPRGQVLWSRLHGTATRNIIMAEDGTGLSVLRAERDFSRVVVFVNGLGQSWIPYGGIHTVLGALPAFVHPNPITAALIGLGSGDTLYGMAGRRELQRITSIEIVEPQLATLQVLASRHPPPGLASLLSDARIEHVFADGRQYIRHAGRRYDIIEADALRPTSAYSGNLYSDEYFRLLLSHLEPRGLAVTWAPTSRIVRTFLTVFPYVWRHGQVMMGSNAPIVFDRAAIVQRLAEPAVQKHYTDGGIDIGRLLAPMLVGWQTFDPTYDRSAFTDINTDLHPRDEFEIADPAPSLQ